MPLTPVKSIIVKVNDVCRVCGENIRVAGRGSLNMFLGKKSNKERLNERFSKFLCDEIVNDIGKSECVCNKCVRELEKYERAMCNADELKKMYARTKLKFVQLAINAARHKRCNSSPSSGIKRVCANNPLVQSTSLVQQKSAKRTLMAQLVVAKENETSMPEITNVDCSPLFPNDETKVEVIKVKCNSFYNSWLFIIIIFYFFIGRIFSFRVIENFFKSGHLYF
jgi:hypothetical protein